MIRCVMSRDESHVAKASNTAERKTEHNMLFGFHIENIPQDFEIYGLKKS